MDGDVTHFPGVPRHPLQDRAVGDDPEPDMVVDVDAGEILELGLRPRRLLRDGQRRRVADEVRRETGPALDELSERGSLPVAP